MRTGRGIAAWIVGWSLAASAVAAPAMSIKFAEPVALAALPGQTQFDAYGRRFALTLENNDRITKSMIRKAGVRAPRAVRGKIDGVPGSWVRLTRVGNGVEGAIWDGKEVYVVARYRDVAAHLTTPLDAAPEQTVVYRLSDTLNGLPPEFCGLVDVPASSQKSGTTGLQQYHALVAELRTSAATAPGIDSLSLSLIADQAFQSLYGSNSTDAMIARLNVVDGIFTDQVGVILVPSETRLMPANSDPFTSTQADTLLAQLSTYRQKTPAVAAAGIAHLMTGKDLDDDVLGIAYINSLCDITAGVSLSDSEEGDFFSALVMAHEIGHNFGARHDGVPGVCESTPQDFLMAPELNGSTQFSQCSLTSMAATIAVARGSCLAAANYVDLAILLPPSPFTPVSNGTGFSMPFSVRSQGNLPATNVHLELTFPAWFTPQDVTLVGATCTYAYPKLACTLADLAAGEERALQMNVTGNPSGGIPIQATLTADDDLIVGNNKGSVDVIVQSGIDLGVTMEASSTAVYANDAVDYTIDVTSTARSSLTSHGGRVQILLSGIPIESFDGGPHACTADASNPGILVCDLADIAAGASTRITIHGRPNRAGTAYCSVDLLNLATDSDPSNNHAAVNVNVSPERFVGIQASTEDLRAVVGTSYEITYTLNATGRLASESVRFSLQQPPAGVIESVTTDGATCTTSATSTDCELGTLNPGDTRSVVVHFHMERSSPSFLSANVRWSNGSGYDFSSVFTNVYANVDIDVAASGANNFGVVEGQIGDSAFTIETRGVSPAQLASGTLELPAPMRLLTLQLSAGPAGWSCTLLTPQSGRCSGSFPANPTGYYDSVASLRYTFSSDVAGDYQAKITAAASGDGDSTNDVAYTLLPVRPYLDVGINAPSAPRSALVGEAISVEGTIFTGKNPVPGVSVRPWAADASLVLDSFDVAGFDCSQTTSGASCNLGDLPGNASIPVRAVFRAVSAEAFAYAVIDVQTAADSANTNNHLAVPVYTLQNSDIRLSVAQSSVTGTAGTLLDLPRITITNGSSTVRDITVDIPLPTFATLLTVQSSEILCSGTATLQCTLAALAPNNSRDIFISMNPVTGGTFTSNIVLHAYNDSTPGNNTASIAITANPPTIGGGGSSSGGGGGGGGGSGSSKSGGGGGGSFGWLALAFLAMLKGGQSLFPGKGGQSPFPSKPGRSSANGGH